jgi:signal peptidase I
MTGAPPPTPKRSIWRTILEFVVILAIAVAVAILVQAFFLRSFEVTSSSMYPTIKPGDRLVADRYTFYFRKPHLGDIVVFRYPPDGPQSLNTRNLWYWPFEQIGEILHLTHRLESPPFVKRVIATEGQTVQVKNGTVFVNGKALKERYKVPDSSNYGPVTVPPGTLFCMGDNRPNSRDSRYIGFIPIRAVIGRAVFRFWPFSRFGTPR